MNYQHSLSDRILQYRLTANVLYDRGEAMGMRPEDIAKEIQPISELLHRTIQEAVITDLAAVVHAIKALEAEAESHNDMAAYFKLKAEDCLNHAHEIKCALASDMGKNKEEMRNRDGFSASLVRTIDGKIRVVVR